MIYFRYLASLLRHKWYVLLSGRRTGVPLWQLIVHDWSKFSPSEFGRYARWHILEDNNKVGWALAWHHHQRLNPHHPEYYLLAWRGQSDFYDGIGQRVTDGIVVLPMPERYVREMVADFMASSKAYTDTWIIAVWLNANGPKMLLHDETHARLIDVMLELGYACTDNCDWSWAVV